MKRLVASLILFGGAAAAAQATYTPPDEGAWETISPSQLGWNEEALEASLDYAKAHGSSALLILYQGHIAAEANWTIESPNRRYAALVAKPTADGRTREDVASAQKSVTSFLCGVANGKGLLDFEKPVSAYLGDGWSNATPAQERAITIHHLMSMSSGLNSALKYDAPAGEKWMYNTNAYAMLTNVLESVTKKDINAITSEWLTKPLAMKETAWETRTWLPAGADANTVGLVTSARDLGRFGLLMLRHGIWNGEDILQNNAYYNAAVVPSQSMNPAYGLLFWLNRPGKRPGVPPGDAMAPAAPSDMFVMAGALNRVVYIVPSKDLVIVRIGDEPDGNFNKEFWERFVKVIAD